MRDAGAAYILTILPRTHHCSSLQSGRFYADILPTLYELGIITQERFAELVVSHVGA